jgi:hypothetical protein
MPCGNVHLTLRFFADLKNIIFLKFNQNKFIHDNPVVSFIYLGFVYKNLHEYKDAEGTRVYTDGQAVRLCDPIS